MKNETYRVRVNYENGMEIIDVDAKDSIDVFQNVAKLIRCKQKRNGCYRLVKSINIERRMEKKQLSEAEKIDRYTESLRVQTDSGKPLIEIL